ncbi:MAG: DUF4013 domain-containing protein [Anaerolineae bacterium]|nr:DUF4013 domain-containing protein [Anaerolineae bacterium]
MQQTLASLKIFFRFPFEDEGWQQRFLIGSGLALLGFMIPVVPHIFIWGYGMRVMRQAIAGQKLTLPAWQDWGRLGRDGVRAMLASIAYTLPGTLALLLGFVLYFVSFLVIPLLSTEGTEWTAFAMLGSIGIMFLTLSIGSLLLFLGMLPLPMAIAHLVARDQTGAVFRVREWQPMIRRNKLGYFIAWIIAGGLVALAYLAIMLPYYTLILFFVGFLIAGPAFFYVSLVSSAIFGQTYRESQEETTL